MPYGMMKSISFASEPPRARQKNCKADYCDASINETPGSNIGAPGRSSRALLERARAHRGRGGIGVSETLQTALSRQPVLPVVIPAQEEMFSAAAAARRVRMDPPVASEAPGVF